MLLTTLLISACSTKPSVKSTSVDTQKTIVPLDRTSEKISAQEQLALAKSLNEQSNTLEQQQGINAKLVSASELFLQEGNYLKALWLANEVSNLVSDEHSIYRLLIVKSASLQALNYTEQALIQLELAKALVMKNNNQNNKSSPVAFTLPYYQTLRDVKLAQSQLADSLSAQLFAFSMNGDATSQDVWQTWQQLITLNPWQVTQIANTKPPAFDGWQQLLQYSNKFGDKPSQLSRYLSLWRQSFPTHPAGLIATELDYTELTSNFAENIAVLLPLSGPQTNAGLAAQQGILAAYQNDTQIKINFIDTNLLDWSTLSARFSDLNIDHVIGPLLKTHVDSFLALSDGNAALQIPTLLLNLPQKHLLTNKQAALSMRPEHEAQQAAVVLSQQNYHSAIILSHQDKVSKRIALAFKNQWQKSTNQTVDIVYFNQGKTMQASLKRSLDVDASQTRINQLGSRLKQTIKTETRNRRDIDMIYLVGSQAQTRLIKPYIDVNTSPFAKVIPVFASSRSHSNFHAVNNENSSSDLQNLTFTQMPWLLPSKQQNKSLAQLSRSLWPKRTDSLSRIFAMGYDSYNLLSKVSLMKQAPYILHFGQTGTLKLDENNILNRSLIWGQYQNNKVTEIVME